MKKLFFICALALSWNALAAEPYAPGLPRSDWSFREAGQIPVQSSGRVKPLDSFAREVLLFVTGSRSQPGWDPVDEVFSWLVFPQSWEDRAFVQVSREDVKRQLGLEVKKSRFSPAEIYKSNLSQYADEISRAQPPMGQKLSPREQELRMVLDRISLFRNIFSGEAWSVIPAERAGGPWKSLASTDPAGETIRSRYANMLSAYRAGDLASFQNLSVEARRAVQAQVPGWSAHDESALSAETFYNRARPFLWAWILYVCAALVWTASIAMNGKGKLAALSLTGVALAMHIVGIGIRCYVAGRPPVTNMYESIIWVSFGVIIFGVILYVLQRQAVLLAVATAVSALALIAADAAPALMDPSLNPLVPVLRSNYWLTVHVLTITLGYAAFALTMGLGNVTLFQHLRGASAAKINGMNQLTYRAMQFGVVLLAAGTILGGIWADYSWGRFWGWDPKEVWALIALLAYLAMLHGRYAGWVGQFGFSVWTVFCFMTVVMAWYGVNFILGAGLHSYGFSSGGTVWVALFVSLQLAYLGFVALVRMQRAKGSKNQLLTNS